MMRFFVGRFTLYSPEIEFLIVSGNFYNLVQTTYTLRKSLQTTSALSVTSTLYFEQPAASFLVCSLIFFESWPQVSICNQKGMLCPLFKNFGGFSS